MKDDFNDCCQIFANYSFSLEIEMTIDVPEIYLMKYYYICIVNLIFILYCDLLYIIFVL